MQIEFEGDWSPQPVCEAHGLKMLYCSPCCARLYEFAGWDDVAEDFVMSRDARHSWAIGNVYKAKEAWA